MGAISEAERSLRVGLDAWIIQDGNYGDFRRGQRCAFALEFWSREPLTIRHPDAKSRDPSLTWLRGSTYAVEGQVSFIAPGWWVIDVGLPIYQGGPPPSIELGAAVKGEVEITIDHFSYFERHAREPGAPALIYDWKIETVEIDTTPWVETRPRLFERDLSKSGAKIIPKTNAWRDDGGRASYTLSCSRLTDAPRLNLRP